MENPEHSVKIKILGYPYFRSVSTRMSDIIEITKLVIPYSFDCESQWKGDFPFLFLNWRTHALPNTCYHTSSFKLNILIKKSCLQGRII